MAAMSARKAAMTESRRAGSVSRMSSMRSTREGTELTAPGWTATVPMVATVSDAAGGGVGGEGVALDGEDHFGGGAEGVAAVGHEQRAGVAAEAFDGVAVAGGRGDVGDDAEGDVSRSSRGPCSMWSSTQAA